MIVDVLALHPCSLVRRKKEQRVGREVRTEDSRGLTRRNGIFFLAAEEACSVRKLDEPSDGVAGRPGIKHQQATMRSCRITCARTTTVRRFCCLLLLVFYCFSWTDAFTELNFQPLIPISSTTTTTTHLFSTPPPPSPKRQPRRDLQKRRRKKKKQ